MDDFRDDRALQRNDSVSLSKRPASVSRFRRWMFPVLTTVVILVLIIAVGASNIKTSNRLWSVEQSVSNLSNVIESLNTSLQKTATELQQLQFSVENNKDQLSSVSDALKQLSAIDTLSHSVALLKCSLENIINNRSAADGCCPVGWELSSSSCYFFSRSVLSWNDSRDWCEKQGSHLAILNNDMEWEFVIRRTVPLYFWVGLTDERTGKWEWVNQTPYTMDRRRWIPGQPDNWSSHDLQGTEDCGHIHPSGHLNDAHCSIKMRYVCQKHSLRG